MKEYIVLCDENKRTGIPRFECSMDVLNGIYDFRWDVFFKHIKNTDRGYVITEFLQDVPWAGIYNTISCAAGHHI